MLNDLLRLLRGEDSAVPLTAEDCRLALAALMVRLARSDDRYTTDEKRMIDRVLSERYGLDRAASESLRREAETAEAEAPDTVRFTRLIKDAVPYEERVAVIEALWKVALAEGLNAEERSFLRLVANLIGVSDQDSGLARQRMESQLPASEREN